MDPDVALQNQRINIEEDDEDDDWYRKDEDGLYCIEVTTNRFSDQEFQRIARTIKTRSRHADRLSISCNKFTVARAQALVEALQHNRSVTVFSIFESQINEAVATELCKAIEYTDCRIDTLELMRNQIEDNAAKLLVQALKTNNSITKLSLLGNIYRFKVLAPGIKFNTSIRVLRLHSERLKSEGCKYLADALKNHPTIEALHLYEHELTERCISPVLEVLPSVTSLTTFKYDNNEPFGDKGCKHLATLLKSATLTSLALRAEITSLTAARTLKAALQRNTVLKSLQLVSTNYAKGGKAVLKVVRALAVNTTLEHLNIASNEFTAVGHDWANKLLCYLKPNTTLKSLDISSTRINSCVTAIADLIRCTSSLTELDLGYNRLEYQVGTIAMALKDNQTLKRLVLKYNGDFALGSKSLAYALKNNTTLQTLDLESSYFEKEVISALQANKSITELNIRHVYCGDPIYKLLSSLLQVNTTLWKINFSENGFNWHEAQHINQLLAHNRKRRATAVELLVAAQVILLPKDRGIFNALPDELIEMIFRYFQLELAAAVHYRGRIIALALDRDFLSPALGDYVRFNKFWDTVLQPNHNV